MAINTSDNEITVTSVTSVASKEKARNSYGQNGYTGPSSVTPGQKQPHMNGGVTDDAMEAVLKNGVRADNYQTRTIDAAPYPTHPNMRDRSTDALEKVPSMTLRGSIARHPTQAAKQGHARHR